MTHLTADQLQQVSTQRGVAALAVILVLLFSISGITLYAANTGVLEQKVAANDHRAKQLAAAADAGLDYAMAYLAANTPTWTADPDDSNFEVNSNSLSTTQGNFLATIQLRRPISERRRVTISSTATETGGGSATAVSQTVILQRSVVATAPESPLVVNGCVSDITGNPDIDNDSSTYEIATSQASACIEQGHFGGATGFDVQGSAFTGSAWDYVFGISKAEMEALAAVTASGVYWIDDSGPFHTNLGSAANPVIVIFEQCARINGGTTIYGIVYYDSGCTSNGWGGANIYGSVIYDGDLSHMNANTELRFDSDYIDDLLDRTIGMKARVPGTWIDL